MAQAQQTDWSQYEVKAPAQSATNWSQYEVAPGAPSPAAQPEPTGLEKAWQWLSTPPRASKEFETIPDEVRSQISDWAGTHLSPKYAPAVAQALDILATPLASVEEAGRRLASPLGLASVGAASVLPEVMPVIQEASPLASKAITGASSLASGVFGAQGLKQAASGLKSGLPAPERIERIAGGLGQAALGAAGAAGPAGEVIEAGRVPKGQEEIIRAAKPSPTEIDFRRNVELATPDIAQTFREQPIEDEGGHQVREVVGKLRGAASDLWASHQTPLINQFGDRELAVDPVARAATEALGDTTGPQASPSNVKRAQKWIDEELSKPMTLRQADQLRRDLVLDTEGEFGQLSAPEYEAKKAALGALRRELYGSMEQLAPGSNIREANMRFGALDNIANVLERRANMAERQPGRLGQFAKSLRGYLFDTMAGGNVPTLGGGIRIGQALKALRGGGIGDTLERGIGRIAKSRTPGPEWFTVPPDWERRLAFQGPPTQEERFARSPLGRQISMLDKRRALLPVNPEAGPVTFEGPSGEPITTEWRGTPNAQEFADELASRGRISNRMLPAGQEGPMLPTFREAMPRAGGPFPLPPSSAEEVFPPAERVSGRYAGLLDQPLEMLRPRGDEFPIPPRPALRNGMRVYPAEMSSTPVPAPPTLKSPPVEGLPEISSPGRPVLGQNGELKEIPYESRQVSRNAGRANPGGAGGLATLPEAHGTGGAAKGKETYIRVPGEAGKGYRARYEVRELADLQPSHNGLNFSPNEKYPFENQRDYENALNKANVIQASTPESFDPELLVSDNPDMANGPSAVTEAGHALGGNRRLNILQRIYAYHPEAASRYRAELEAKAQQFGVNPASIRGMKQPALVRVVPESEIPDSAAAQKAIAEFNRVGTASLTPSERAISDAKMMTPEALDFIGGKLHEAGEDATLADVLRDSGKEIVDNLIEDGVIAPQEKAAYIGKGGITDAGKDRISKLVIGKFFDDASELDNTPASVRNKLARIAAPLAGAATVPGYDLRLDVQEALQALQEMRAHGLQNVDDLAKQGALYKQTKYSSKALELAKALHSRSGLQLTRMARAYARAAAESVSKQGSLMGPRKITPDQAFQEAFGQPFNH